MFGPTFSDELAAAGLLGLPIVWGSDGVISGRDALTPAQNTALDAVLAAHDPSRVAPVTRIERRQGLITLALIGELMPGVAQIGGAPVDAIDEDDIEAMLDAVSDKRLRAIARAEFRHSYWLIDSPWLDAGCDHFGIPREAKQALFDDAATR